MFFFQQKSIAFLLILLCLKSIYFFIRYYCIATYNDTFISILEKYIEQKHKDGITSDRSYRRDLETVVQIKRLVKILLINLFKK